MGEDGGHGAGYFFGGSCEGKLTCSHLLEAPLPKTTAIYRPLILPATQAIFAPTV